MTNSSEVCECGHKREEHNKREGCCYCYNPNFPAKWCDCKKFKPQTPQKTNSQSQETRVKPALQMEVPDNTQTPPTLKDDLTSYWVEWNEQYDVYDDVNKIIAEKIKRLRDKIKINGNLHTESCEHCLITGYTARHENMIFELIDEIMGDWE